MWARLMMQLVHTHRACFHIPCVSCVLVIVSMADLRPYSLSHSTDLMSELMKLLTAMRMVEAMMHRSMTTAKSDLETLAWYSCSMCSAMSTAAECLCC